MASVLALMIPFEAGRNIDMQGGLLIIAGVFAWTAIALRHKLFIEMQERRTLLLLGIMMFSVLLSTLVNPHLGYDLFGAPLMRLGSLGLFACIGIGMLAQTVPSKKLITYLYVLICIICLLSIPYNVFQFDSTDRIGGVFAQADVLAVVSACGFLLGLRIYKMLPSKRVYVLLCQLSLLIVLVMTQTRVPLILVFFLSIGWLLIQQKTLLQTKTLIVLAATMFILILGALLLPPRITDVKFAKESADYRFSLQEAGLQQTLHKPLLGYGLGNIADPLSCDFLTAENLQSTCQKNFYFNSSHNIFLDRVLGVGWIGGLAYAALVVLAIWKGLIGNNETRILAFCVLLIAVYYLTNVTSLVLEMLLWILMFQVIRKPSITSSRVSA